MDDTFSRDERDDAGPSDQPGAAEPKSLRAGLSGLLANGEAWRFKDLAARLRSEAPESEIYRELRALIRAGAVRRVRHGVYLAVGPYDWSAPVEAEAGVPVIQSAIYSQLHRLRTVDELRTVLGLPREVVWRSLRALIQSGAVCTGEPLGVFREMTFIRRDRAGGAAPAAPTEDEAIDAAILGAIEPGRLYSAHAVAAHADILVRTIKLSLRKLSTLGTVRCFVFDDGMYFYQTLGEVNETASHPVKAVDIYAELGAVNVATLDVIEAAEEGLSAARVGRQLETVFKGSRNTAARIITKLRRAGLVQMRDAAQGGETVWEATDIGSDVMAIARGTPVAVTPAPAAAEVRYDVAPTDEVLAYRRLAEWILDTITARDGSVRKRIPVNKRILARSLNITKPHLDRCFRLLGSLGVTIEGWDIVVPDPEPLRALLRD